MTRPHLALLFILLSVGGLLHAAEVNRITADRMEWKEKQGLTRFSGNVHFSQPKKDIAIEADTITIQRRHEQVVSVIAIGSPVRFHHRGRSEVIEGQANQMTYNADSDTIVLDGNAVVKNGTDTIQGDQIRYDIHSRAAIASSSADNSRRFEAVIHGKDKGTTTGKQK